MAGHTTTCRVFAVFCFAWGLCNLDWATTLFCIWWNGYEAEHVTEVKDFIARTVTNLTTRGTVHDKPRSGRRLKLSNERVDDCVQALKAGYEVTAVLDEHTGLVGTDHVFYTTVTQAAIECKTIKECLAEFNISVDYLRTRMHERDPNLKHIKLDYKEELDEQQKGGRQAAAKLMLARLAHEPDFLDRVCWVDEWHCWCTPEHCATKVWADAHDARARAVLPIKKQKNQDKVLIRCVAVVNARLGPIHMEFTTGTTGLKRELVDRDPNTPYLVSSIYKPYTAPSMPRSPGCYPQHLLTLLYVHALPITIACYLSHLHCGIARCQHHAMHARRDAPVLNALEHPLD